MKNKITLLTTLLLVIMLTISVTAKGKNTKTNVSNDMSKFNEKIYIATNSKQKYKGDLSKYAKKYNINAEKDYIDLNIEDIDKLLGTPAYTVKYREKTTAEFVLEKEVLIYTKKFKEGTKALYLLLEQGKVVDYVITNFDALDDARIVSIFDDIFPEK